MAAESESSKHDSPTNSHKLFEDYFGSRSDIGFTNLLLDVALEPRDPFKTWERRRWKKGFVAALLFVLATLGWFTYFSLMK
jgi:hypothetical protein